MTEKIWFSEKIRPATLRAFVQFLQRQANRFAMGHLRYGEPNPAKEYLRRLKAEVRAYERTGNAEHLGNVAVYAYLETEAPSHGEAHWDATAPSATRRR